MLDKLTIGVFVEQALDDFIPNHRELHDFRDIGRFDREVANIGRLYRDDQPPSHRSPGSR